METFVRQVEDLDSHVARNKRLHFAEAQSFDADTMNVFWPLFQLAVSRAFDTYHSSADS